MGLTSVIPGVREVRAPLAAGYLWLLLLYLIVGLPDAEPGSVLIGRTVAVADAMTPAGVAVGLGFVAYLVGSLMHQIAVLAAGSLTRLVTRGRRYGVLTSRGYDLLDDLVARMTGDGIVTSVTDAAQVAEEILDELDLLRTRLLSTDPGLFGEVDRLNAAAELRLAVCLPVGGLAVLGAGSLLGELWRTSAFGGWLVILVALSPILVTEALWAHGLTTQRMANDKLIDALFLGRIQSPVIERWEREARMSA